MADEADSTDVLGVAAGRRTSRRTSRAGRGQDRSGPDHRLPDRLRRRLDQPARRHRPSWTSHELTFGAGRPWEEPAVAGGGRPMPTSGPPTSPGWSARSPRRPDRPQHPARRAGRGCRSWPPSTTCSSCGQRTDAELALGVIDDPARAGAAHRLLPARRRRQHGGLRHRWLGQVDRCCARWPSRPASPRARARATCTGSTSASAGLRMLEPLPHVGSIISGDDDERVVRLIKQLRETRRRTRGSLRGGPGRLDHRVPGHHRRARRAAHPGAGRRARRVPHGIRVRRSASAFHRLHADRRRRPAGRRARGGQRRPAGHRAVGARARPFSDASCCDWPTRTTT